MDTERHESHEVESMNLSPEIFEYPEWQRPYLEAMLELDKTIQAARLAAAETAIQARTQELASSSNGHRELEALQNALSALRVLKRDLLRAAGDGSV